VSAPALQSVAGLYAQRPPRIGEALSILRDAATALGKLHATGKAHGAVCLENILLDAEGAARLCHDTTTPPTASPEQERGEPPDARSDVYALGAAVAELLAGAGPLPEPISRMLAAMTAEDPGDRYNSMDEVLTALEACELMTGHVAFRLGHEAAATRSRRRALVVLIVAMGLVVLSLAMLVIFSRTPPPSGDPPDSYKELVEKRPTP